MGREYDPMNKNPSANSGLVPLRISRRAETADRSTRLLTVLRTAYGGRPRALMCFDFETGSALWRYDLGPFVLSAEAVDLDGDGLQDFVCGTSAPDNGNHANDGTDDAHSYALAFSSYGTNLWRRVLGEELTGGRVLLANVGATEGVGLFACRHTTEFMHHSNSTALGQIWRLDRKTGKDLASYQAPSCFVSWQALEDLGTPEARILASDCYGYIHVLRASDLSPVRLPVKVVNAMPRRAGSYDSTDLQIIKIGRFAPGIGQQVLAQTEQVRQLEHEWFGNHNEPPDLIEYENREILLLNSDLELMARYEVASHATAKQAWTVKAMDMDGDGIEEILLLSDHVEILKFRSR